MKILLSFVFSALLASGILVSCEEDNNTTLSPPTTNTTTTTTTTTTIATTPIETTPETNTTTTSTTTTDASTTTISTSTPPTTEKSTTSAPPITTESPKPTPTPGDCSWNVTGNNGTCIRVEIKALFTIDIEGKSYYLALSQNATSSHSTCYYENGTQLLSLTENGLYSLSMVFKEEANKVFVDNTSFTYSLPEGEGHAYNDKDKLFPVKAGNSYKCQSHFKIDLGNITIDINYIHIEAFAKDEANFGTTEECDADDQVSDAVPIAVGCALAALIVIVLIAYLVGRRQSRQKGYQSV